MGSGPLEAKITSTPLGGCCTLQAADGDGREAGVDVQRSGETRVYLQDTGRRTGFLFVLLLVDGQICFSQVRV